MKDGTGLKIMCSIRLFLQNIRIINDKLARDADKVLVEKCGMFNKRTPYEKINHVEEKSKK